MSLFRLVLLTSAFVFCFPMKQSYCQPQIPVEITWDTPLRISSDSIPSNIPQLAVNGDTVHIIWFGTDETGTISNDGIQYSRSLDGGDNFDSPRTLISFDTAQATGLFLASSGSTIALTYVGFADTFFGAFLLLSTDAGTTWLSPKRIRHHAYPLSLGIQDSLVLVFYEDPFLSRQGLLRSTNFGDAWTSSANIFGRFTGFTFTTNRVHAIGPTSGDFYTEVGYYFSTNGGASWIGPEILSRNDNLNSLNPSIIANERGHLHAVWTDTGSVVSRSSLNGGVSWRSQKVVSSEIGAVSPRVGASQEFVTVMWDRDVGGITSIRNLSSNDFGFSYGIPGQPTLDPTAGEPALALNQNTVHFAWKEGSSNETEIHYRRGSLPMNPDIADRPPQSYALRQNYPNPSNGLTHIAFDLPEPAFVTLTVYNILGQRVALLASDLYSEGRYSVSVDVTYYATGVYFYELQAGTFREIKKFAVIR